MILQPVSTRTGAGAHLARFHQPSGNATTPEMTGCGRREWANTVNPHSPRGSWTGSRQYWRGEQSLLRAQLFAYLTPQLTRATKGEPASGQLEKLVGRRRRGCGG